jgi:3-phosphoshikimate 1-carboxyvinyltransferase
MAMSFAVAALRSPGIRLRDPGCVAKTFPGFFDVLDAVTP